MPAGFANLRVRECEHAGIVSACLDLEHDRCPGSFDTKGKNKAVVAWITGEDTATVRGHPAGFVCLGVDPGEPLVREPLTREAKGLALLIGQSRHWIPTATSTDTSTAGSTCRDGLKIAQAV